MWRAILPPSHIDQARESITDISLSLSRTDRSQSSVREDCEFALLSSYLWKDDPTALWRDQCIDCLNCGIEKASTQLHQSVGLFGGIAGLGWLISHVCCVLAGDSEIDSLEEEDPLVEIDRYLLRLLVTSDCCHGVYDLINGYVGVGLYWLERPSSVRRTAAIHKIVSHLKQLSHECDPGITWFTPAQLVPPSQQDLAPTGYFNLGVAHGVPGILPFLASVVALGLDQSGCALQLFYGAVNWLLAQERTAEQLSRYSTWIIPGHSGGDSRLGWCYGDLGIAAAIAASSRLMRDPHLHLNALDLLRGTFKRTTKESSGIVDAPLCHGAFGAAHIYNRFYQWSDERHSRDAAIHWYLQGLSMRKPGVGIGGYYEFRLDLSPRERSNPSFLSGATGVALALLAAVNDVEPAWDRLLMISGICSV